ncbi:hypothetical protein DTL21_11430 [Bremerella cremea]|uniref:Uncharacterized protein n=2 Tax=Pirellulales TaxID=2691354 RepID=A0A2S8FPM6_9BACT|nr:hypothetical protein C5Y83_11425 [Blastopirellula marina]RCS46642.1 hypothetical protein DTL21_11430 [Bremerella cremea]
MDRMNDQFDDNPYRSPAAPCKPEGSQPSVSEEKSHSVIRAARLAWQLPTLGAACYFAAIALLLFGPRVATFGVPLLVATLFCLLLGLAYAIYAASWNKQIPEAGTHAGFGMGVIVLLFFLMLLGCAGIAELAVTDL